MGAQLQSGCQCGGCDGFRAPEMWCGGARHHFICDALKTSIGLLWPAMAEKYTDNTDMLVLAHAVKSAAENAAQNIEYLQSKETTTP
jgi:hypothetical protein